MFEFFRYETVTIPMTVKPKEKLEDYDEIVVSLKQNDIEINKTGDEVGVNVETGSINIYLTQEETALFKKGSAKIQVNIYYTDKERDTSYEAPIQVLENLYQRIMD